MSSPLIRRFLRGLLVACLRTKLSATTGGRIEVLAVKEGDRVKKGPLLMKLWNDDQQVQGALALTQVESARKRLTEVCALAENAESEAEHQASLYKQGFESRSRDEQARADAQAAATTSKKSSSTLLKSRDPSLGRRTSGLGACPKSLPC